MPDFLRWAAAAGILRGLSASKRFWSEDNALNARHKLAWFALRRDAATGAIAAERLKAGHARR